MDNKLFSGRKKAILDVLLNITATVLPLAMLQLLVYPQIARVLGGQEYGLMLSIYSIWIMLPHSLGNVLNNIKLLKVTEYQRLGTEGDIAILVRKWLALGATVSFAIIWIYCGKFTPTHILIGTVIAVLIFLKSYLEVGFRIKLDFVAVLINNALMSVGYILGFVLFSFTHIWEFVFLLGYLFPCIYCTLKTNLLKELPQKTILYQTVQKDAYSLVFSSIIRNLTHYADKLVLYPLMGGTAVSIYYTATILGKITGMLTGPINSVFLSYIARWDKSRANVFSKVLLIGLVICSAGYVVVLLIAKPVLGFLFPQWLDAVMKLMPLTTVTVMLGVLVSVLNPFVLKFCKLQWLVIINIISSVVYFGSALVLWHYLGLEGFCIGTIIGLIVRLSIMICVYFRSVGKA